MTIIIWVGYILAGVLALLGVLAIILAGVVYWDAKKHPDEVEQALLQGPQRD